VCRRQSSLRDLIADLRFPRRLKNAGLLTDDSYGAVKVVCYGQAPSLVARVTGDPLLAWLGTLRGASVPHADSPHLDVIPTRREGFWRAVLVLSRQILGCRPSGLTSVGESDL